MFIRYTTGYDGYSHTTTIVERRTCCEAMERCWKRTAAWLNMPSIGGIYDRAVMLPIAIDDDESEATVINYCPWCGEKIEVMKVISSPIGALPGSSHPPATSGVGQRRQSCVVYHLHQALQHLMFKNHPLTPATCEGCLEIAAFIAVPGYQGNGHPEVH